MKALRNFWYKNEAVIVIVITVIIVALVALVVIVPNKVAVNKANGGVIVGKFIIGHLRPHFYVAVSVETNNGEIVKTIKVTATEYYSLEEGSNYIKN